MENENTLQRIKKFIDHIGISVRAFEQSIGVSNGSFASQLKNDGTIGVDKLENILQVYDNINAEWLLRGKGSMFKESQEIHNNATSNNESSIDIVIMIKSKEKEISEIDSIRQYREAKIQEIDLVIRDKEKKIQITREIDQLRKSL